MVSLRRRRLLGLCPGIDSHMVEILSSFENDNLVENSNQNCKQSTVHPLPTDVVDQPELIQISEELPESASLSGSTSMKEEPEHDFPDKQFKYRKHYRRKRYKDQEQPTMRGVYLKNTKYQAAIKVDKRQIHLGTVKTQAEAARLYDRAAYICGRQPNLELSKEEKQELSKYKWDEFLEMTKRSIASKKNQRRQGGGGIGRGKRLIGNLETGITG
ncbi:ethylene-responsive transcription factor-like protein At4g13040 [Dioscorea cayenensis subsp. rotundata]|uniref:Ethylene-responsive transcription factor-like protein At4g13040 n=1 Tax=Dioscorea cayennensis subsp. rotundata TaxID=55577 RepID=A0AB40CHT7_DIOCR|nr:ethylene-responsive transcription factor-like protein At4g13040 [Dioscorea cayenensis subsp. rotundata]